MKKWLLIAGILVVVVIAVAEGARRSSRTEAAGTGVGETGTGAAVVERLKGNEWEARKPVNTDAGTDQEFDQAERITDSREEDLDKAKKNVRVIRDAVRNN